MYVVGERSAVQETAWTKPKREILQKKELTSGVNIAQETEGRQSRPHNKGPQKMSEEFGQSLS